MVTSSSITLFSFSRRKIGKNERKFAKSPRLVFCSTNIGNPHSSIVDGLSTMVLGDKSKIVKVLSWYDNEWGFACRLIDLIKFVANMMHS